MNKKEIEKAVETIKIAIAEVEWNYPMDYAVAFETAIKCMETAAKIPNVIEELQEFAEKKREIQKKMDKKCSVVYINRAFSNVECYEMAIKIIKEKLCGGKLSL